jgi:phosphatidylglycerophosphatase A
MAPMNDSSSNEDLSLDRESNRGLAVWLATGLGIGLIGPAPGTLGALEGLVVAWGFSLINPPAVQWVAIAALLILGVPLCTQAARRLGGKDPQPIVWDELSTVPLVFAFVPLTNWKVALIGFLLHRLFDISKPWPCRRLERLPEGLGIMADDMMASFYAALMLWGVKWVMGPF